MPTPAAQAQARQHWHPLRVTLYGRQVTPLVFRGTALWYSVQRDAPVRYVVVRDPSGRRKDAACCCTDRAVSVAFLLQAYAARWTLEVTFFLLKGLLGFAEPQHQTVRAVRRTAPFAGLVFALVVLWYAGELQAGRAVPWLVRPWYRRKAAPSFADVLAALRQAGLAQPVPGRPPRGVLTPPWPPRRPTKPRCRRQLGRCGAASRPGRGTATAPACPSWGGDRAPDTEATGPGPFRHNGGTRAQYSLAEVRMQVARRAGRPRSQESPLPHLRMNRRRGVLA